MKRFLMLVISVLLVLGGISGCNSSKDKLSDKEVKSSETEKQPGNDKPVVPEDTVTTESKEEKVKPEKINTFKAALYFHDSEAMFVTKEERDIQVENLENLDVVRKAKICIDELVKGSAKGLSNSIPAGTKVMSIKLDKDTLIIDLSREFEKGHSGGSAGVLMTMSQLVLTLTELDGVQQVSFKIEGRTVEDFKGAIELNKPFARNEYEQYIKK